MKAFLCLFLLLATIISATTPRNQPFDNTIDVIKGILSELNKNGDVTNLASCVSQLPLLVKSVEDFIDQLKKVQWTDMEAVFNMFISFFDAMKEIFVSLKPCVKVPADFKHLAEKIGQINLDKLLQRIMLHSFQLFAWITDAIKDLGEGRYYEFGEGMGRIAYLVLLDDSFSA